MKIILINGAPCSGKSSFCQFAIEQADGVTEYSTVSVIKGIAEQIGWNGQKTSKDRRFLSDLKDLLTDYNDFPARDCENFIRAYLTNLDWQTYKRIEPIIFIHCREPLELERLKKKWNAKTLVVRRKEAEEQSVSNHADAEVLEYDYDYSINNDGTLNDLMREALEFIRYIETEDFESHI